jgi:hypothetical protein
MVLVAAKEPAGQRDLSMPPVKENITGGAGLTSPETPR